MSENVAPMPDAGSRAGRGDKPASEERLEVVADRLRRLADESTQTIGWVEAEVEAMRTEVRQSLRLIAERAAADREELVRQVALLRETLSGMHEALRALRDEVIALTGGVPAPASASRTRPGAGDPARTGLGLPPRRSASAFPGPTPERRPRP